jgi:hypothetical protein
MSSQVQDRLPQGFAWDRPGMQTKATDDPLAFDEGDAPPLFGSSQGGFLAGRATSDYDEIVLEMLVSHGISLLVVCGVSPDGMSISLTFKN